MPVEKKVAVLRWQWCEAGGIIPYPCRKKATKVKWCYHFSELTVKHFYCCVRYEGKENGATYSWWTWKWSFSKKTSQKKNKEICVNKLLTPV